MMIDHGRGIWRSSGRLVALSVLMIAAPLGLHALADETAPQEQELGAPGAEELAAGANDAAPTVLDAPAEERALALRELWRSRPGFGAPDGLGDYDGDYATVRPIRR